MFRRLFSTQETLRFGEVTDLVLEDARWLKRRLGKNDQHKFEEYFESIRMIEQQMERLGVMRDALTKVMFRSHPSPTCQGVNSFV